MNILINENMIKVKKVWLDNERIFIETDKGEVKSHPFSWFPRLFKATPEERRKFELSPFGIHWPELDEDLCFEGFFEFSKI